MAKEKPLKLPEEVPVFPLPNVVLFPHVDLPLYIFEPRYQKMLQDALLKDRLICMALIKEGWEEKKEPYPVYDICGVGMVKFSAENPDKTSNLILRGLARVRVVDFVQEEPYRIGKIKIIKDESEDSNEERALTEKVKDLFIKKVGLRRTIIDEEQIEAIRQLEDASRICDIIAFFSSVSIHKRQEILECLKIKERLRKVIKVLEGEIRELESRN